MKNEVVVSGLVSETPTAIKNDGIIFTVSNPDKNGTKDYLVTAYSELATLLSSRLKTGQRIAFAGRVSSEELEPGTGAYHAVLQASRLLSLGGEEGVPYAQGTIQGLASCDGIKITKNGSGTAVASLNVKRTFTIEGRNGKEDRTTTSYHTVTVWGDKTEALKPYLPMKDVFITAFGQLIPGEYESTKHGTMIKKVEIWADEVTIAGNSSGAVAAPRQAARPGPNIKQASREPKASSSLDADMPF